MFPDIHEVRAIFGAREVSESLAEVISMRYKQCNTDDRDGDSQEASTEDTFRHGLQRKVENTNILEWVRRRIYEGKVESG